MVASASATETAVAVVCWAEPDRSFVSFSAVTLSAPSAFWSSPAGIVIRAKPFASATTDVPVSCALTFAVRTTSARRVVTWTSRESESIVAFDGRATWPSVITRFLTDETSRSTDSACRRLSDSEALSSDPDESPMRSIASASALASFVSAATPFAAFADPMPSCSTWSSPRPRSEICWSVPTSPRDSIPSARRPAIVSPEASRVMICVSCPIAVGASRPARVIT